MKFIQVLFIVFFSLLMVANMSYGRKDLGEYWKNKMNEEAMPEAIKNLIKVPAQEKDDHSFVKDFDVHSNIILYHQKHDKQVPSAEKEDHSFVRNFDVHPNIILYHQKHDKHVQP
ncbi:uncharacterized protein LOC131617774 [Vicia villosa]|uniref:uncharacterized protein LOC131617774 n=1 Tax=Vicia villosa TaxID=3911 RepID=UPI00273C7047|nr:uncharacterized protein LOC131617774 [Vicia villosa]